MSTHVSESLGGGLAGRRGWIDTIARPGAAGVERGPGDFSSILARPLERPGASAAERARSAAEQFVAVALVQPVLKQLRESSLAAPPFAPTQGERQFQGLYDAEIARRLVSAAHFPLVDRLAHDLLHKGRGPIGPGDRAGAEVSR